MNKLFTLFFFIFASFAFASSDIKISNPILEKLIYNIRDPKTGKRDFRKSLEKIGEYLAYDIAKKLKTSPKIIKTCLDVEAEHQIINENIVLLTILRAGLPFFNGTMRVFDKADVGFFAMRRNEQTLRPAVDYVALPPLRDKTVIVTDTMIATGGSLISALKTIKEQNPKKIIILGVIIANYAIEKIREFDPDIEIYGAAIDPMLNDKGYILPGLGDAGDRCFGTKHH